MEREELTPDERPLWDMLADIPAPPADSVRMRARFDAALRAGRPRRVWSTARPWMQAAAAVILLASGMAIGRRTAPAPAPSPEIAVMRQELHDLREMVSLSLMQQQSASDRLKGVTWSSQLEQPGDTIVRALLDTLMHDPNVNVRLASIDALRRFAAQQSVRRGTVDALEMARSPLVQIALIDFMVETNAREAAPMLRRLAMDERLDDTVRKRAAWGARQLG